MKTKFTWAWMGLVAALLWVGGAAVSFSHAQGIPADSALYRLKLTRYAQAQFGAGANVAVLAAQVQQESNWKPNASSGVAHGLTQFTKPTGQWITTICTDLAPMDLYDPDWSLRAQSCYMRYLTKSITTAATECDLWAFALADYNGGRKWRLKEADLAAKAGANPRVWFGSVALFRARGVPAYNENRGYPRRILLDLQPRYVRAGYPGAVLCRP